MRQDPVTQAPLEFGIATAADIPALVALVTSAYRGESSRAGWTTEADLLDGNRIDADLLRADIERPRSQVLLAWSLPRRALVACAHVAQAGESGYFGMFAVDPAVQGGGIGKQLLAHAEHVVGVDWQLPLMRMQVIDVRDELIAFYERRGYVRTGVHAPFPYGDARFGAPRRDDLRFETLQKVLRA